MDVISYCQLKNGTCKVIFSTQFKGNNQTNLLHDYLLCAQHFLNSYVNKLL